MKLLPTFFFLIKCVYIGKNLPRCTYECGPHEHSNSLLVCVCVWLDYVEMFSLDRKHNGKFLFFLLSFFLFLFFLNHTQCCSALQPRRWALTPALRVGFTSPCALAAPSSNKYTVQEGRGRQMIQRGQMRWGGQKRKEWDRLIDGQGEEREEKSFFWFEPSRKEVGSKDIKARCPHQAFLLFLLLPVSLLCAPLPTFSHFTWSLLLLLLTS